MKSNRRLKNSLLLFGCPQTQDTYLTTLLGCTRKMKPSIAPLAMITQRHWSCLGPCEVCHLQLPGEQRRSKGTEWAALGCNFNTEHRKSMQCIHCQDRTKKHKEEQQQQKYETLPSHQLLNQREKKTFGSHACVSHIVYILLNLPESVALSSHIWTIQVWLPAWE